jgi:dephospho-CoA kinase
MKILGISGTNGSGKDSLGQMLQERHGWLFVPATDILREELRRRGKQIERENLRSLGNEWRKQFGAGVLIDKSVDLYEKGEYRGLAIASIRSVGEAERVHELGGKIIWVDADPKIRYERINGRQRSTEDAKSFEQFLDEQRIEMHGSEDKDTVNMAGVKVVADIFIENHGNSLDEFLGEAEKALKNFI